jgi:hypothetical protein
MLAPVTRARAVSAAGEAAVAGQAGELFVCVAEIADRIGGDVAAREAEGYAEESRLPRDDLGFDQSVQHALFAAPCFSVWP